MQVEVSLALSFVSRLILGIVFLRSARGKIADIASFARGLSAYQLLPTWAIASLAWLLPLLELLLALAFLVGWMLPIISLAAVLLLITFIVAIIINLRRGRTISCNCHGSSAQTPISWGLVTRNILLVMLALLVIYIAPFHMSLSTLVAHWRTELTLLFSSSALPMGILIICFITCSQLLSTIIDVRLVVRQVK